MADPAGLTVGVVALAGLFNNAVQCFEYVQLGRGFGKDFQTSQLKLDNARLRLSRWGSSLGLGNNNQDVQALGERFNPDTVKQAQALLGQILELFDNAESVSDKYRNRAQPNDDRLAICNPQTDLDPDAIDLHQKMRQLAIERQSQSSLKQKIKWALYEDKSFRRLIEDISELTQHLVELFPATKEVQQRLCDQEVSSIGENKVLSILKDIAAEQDKLLEDAIAKVVSNPGGTHHITFSGGGNRGLQLGHNSGTMSGLTFGDKG